MRNILRVTTAVIATFALAAPAAVRAQDIDAARAALLAAWEAAPLEVSKAIFVSEPAAGYGLYDERADAAFAAGDPIYIYIEPVGYGWKPAGSLNEFGLSIGLVVNAEAGTEAFRDDEFLTLSTRSTERPTEFFGNVTLNLSGFPPGSYVLELTLGDLASDETAEVSLPLEIE